MFDLLRHRRWLFVLGLLALAAPGYSDSVTVSGDVTFASLDGSSLDHDGVANGTFTVSDGDLTVLGSINCNDDGPGSASACAMRFIVSGNFTVTPGGALYAENRRAGGDGGNITAVVGGNLVVGGTISSGNSGNDRAGDIAFTVTGMALTQAGSVVSAASKGGQAGAINLNSATMDIRGLIASGPSSTMSSTKYTAAILTGGSSNSAGGAITLRSMSHAEPSIVIGGDATIVSEGDNAGSGTVILEGCGVVINGLVASISNAGAGAAVIVRSGTTALVDGRDLGAAGTRLGMLRADSINQGAGGYSANIFARNTVTVQGPGAGALYVVNSNGGKTSKDPSGTINVIVTAGGIAASGNAFAATGSNSGDQGGTINLSARDNVVLAAAGLNASGDFTSGDASREGGAIAIRSYSGAVSWLAGSGDVRPTGSGSGVAAAQQGTINITYCTTVSTAGTSFPTNGAPVGVFPTVTSSCSPASPSLPPGESHPDCNDPPVAVNDVYTVAEGGTLTVVAPGVLTNDVDPDGDPMTASLVSGPAHASSFTLDANGSFNYVHDGSETTTDSFTYRASDGSLNSNVATVTIAVTPVNDAPVANNDSYSVNEGGTLNVAAPGVMSNDVDADGPTRTAIIVSGPAHASSFALNANGSFTYVHDGSETTSDAFTYKVSDGSLESNVAAVTISVTAVNDAPVANNDSYSVNEGGTLNVAAPGVLSNDTDTDSASIHAVLVSGPTHASSFTLNANGSFNYIHDGSETTSDSFTYKANDGSLDSNVATVSITVNAVNDAPVAANDSYSVDEGGTLNIIAPGVLANDTDADSASIHAVLVSGPAHAASFTLNANGSFNYVHDGSETTSDSFTYKANDGSLDSNVATVTITVNPVNDAPVAVNDSYSVDEGGTLNIAAPGVLANDTDADSASIHTVLVNGPAHASSFTLNADGSFTYVHDGSETTNDSFKYRANDGSLDSNVATVTITINPVNDAPAATNDGYAVNEGATLSVPAPGVLVNDIDVDSASIHAVLVSGPAHAASFTLNANGSFTYVHDGSETTSDSFTYKANDGSLDSNIATASIVINPVNDPPVANNDAFSVNEGGSLTVTPPGVLGNDTDAEGNPLTAAVVAAPTHAASFTFNPDGSFTYVHDGSETLSDSFTYRANDGSAFSNVATVTITINPVNDAPVANNDSYSVSVHHTLNVAAPGVLGNDTDAEGNALTAVLVTGPTQGSLTLNPDGSFSYTHTGSTVGTDTFTYRAQDSFGALSNIAAVTISIINQAPVANNDAFNSVGNTELRVGTGATLTPAVVISGSVLANDTDSDGPSPLVVSAFEATSFSGGTVSMNPDGTFNYLPPVGFVGTDSFHYSVSDGSATSAAATVAIAMTDRVWYVNSTAAGTQTGRSTQPFATLTQAQGASAINDYIHLAQGTYSAGITLKDNQRLVGSGVPLVVGAFTLAPATVRPVVSASITLASANLVTGLTLTPSAQGIIATAVNSGKIVEVDVNGGTEAIAMSSTSGTFVITDVRLTPTGSGLIIVGGTPIVNASNLDIVTTIGTGIFGTAGTLNISAGADGSTITTTGGIAADLTAMALNMSLLSVSVNGGSNGIKLQNTTGTFTVTGDNSLNANGSGGSIVNVSLRPVHLIGAGGTVSLRSMNMSLAQSAASGVLVDNNAGGTLAVNLAGCSITGANSSAQGKALLQVEAAASANVAANVQGSFFNRSFNYGMFATAADTSILNVTVNQSGFGTDVVANGAVNNPGTVITLPNVIGLAVTNSGSAQVDYSVTNNTFWGSNGVAGAVYAVTFSSSANGAASHLTGSFTGNKIGQAGVLGSGCSGGCAGVGLLPGVNGMFSATVMNNDIRQVGTRGIDYANTVSGAVGSNVIKIKGNTLTEPDSGAAVIRRAISVTTGNSGGAASNVCAEIGGAAAGEKNTVSGTWQAGNFVRVTTANTTGTLTLPGLAPTAGATAAQINAFIAGNNVGVAGNVNTTIGGAIVGGAPCP
jgi:VCBS repeat-containing protein